MFYLRAYTVCILIFLSHNFSFAEDIEEYENESEELVANLSDAYLKFIGQRYILFQHKANYLMLFSYNNKPNNAPFEATIDSELLAERGDFVQPLEAEFQISFKILVTKNIFRSGFDAFLAYTQQSWWQIYNGSWSKPFRETNYNPELFGRKIFVEPKRFLGAYIAGYDIGYMHESNGQVNELSRSWDRMFIRGLWGTSKFRMLTTLWFRIPESSRRDQNPDITDFKGVGELEVIYQPNKNELRMKLIPGLKKAGVELSYSYPIKRDFRLFVKANYGYGHSLLDYDHKVQRIGLGISLTDPISQFFQSFKEKNKDK